MINITYDPILGFRCTTSDADPRTAEKPIIQHKAKEQFNRTNNIRAKQMRKAQNMKSK